MQGTTVLAKFRDLHGYEGIDIGSLTLHSEVLQKESKLTRESILNAVETYNLVINGKKIPEKKAPLASLKDAIAKKSFLKRKGVM